MKKVLWFSLPLILGLSGSQYLDLIGEFHDELSIIIRLWIMFLLPFIMIHGGYEFEIDRCGPGKYAPD